LIGQAVKLRSKFIHIHGAAAVFPLAFLQTGIFANKSTNPSTDEKEL
jgi:hypothetical protein